MSFSAAGSMLGSYMFCRAYFLIHSTGVRTEPQQYRRSYAHSNKPVHLNGKCWPETSLHVAPPPHCKLFFVVCYVCTSSRISPLPQQHPRLANTDLPGCIVRQDFHCAVLSDAFGQEGVDQCLSFHPNGLAVVQLAPTHPAVGGGDRQERRAYCSTF